MKIREIIKKKASLGLKKYPIGIYNYLNLKDHGAHMTEAEMESLADAGITVPHSPTFDPNDSAQIAHMLKMLDWAAARDMKLVLWDPRCMASMKGLEAPAEYAAGVKAAVRDFGKHPGLLGFFNNDEPDDAGMRASAACQRIQAEVAPHLLSVLNHLGGASDTYLDTYAQLSDAGVMSYDCYLQIQNPAVNRVRGIDRYFQCLRNYREASLRNGIPFWNTVICIGHWMYSCPNLDEIRWQFNTSVAAGASGVSWFHWYLPKPILNYRLPPVDEFWEKTQTYYDIRRVQQSFHKTYGDLFNRLVSTRVSFYPFGCGEGSVEWTPNELVSGIETQHGQCTPILVGEFTDGEGRRYVMFVNNSQTKDCCDHVKIKFPKNAKLYCFEYGSEGKEQPAGNYEGPRLDGDTIRDWRWLAPGQEALYRVELPDEKV